MNDSLVGVEVVGNVGVVTIENPPVNAMSPGVPRSISVAINAFNELAEVDSIVLRGGGKGNIAGADIRFQGSDWPQQEPTLRDLISVLEVSTKPVVAALGPNTLGGGLEIAMSCHYRVIARQGKVGQPEVTLGIPPGAGGTQRLPRLAPPEIALDMIVSGKPVDAVAAKSAGIVDQIVDGDLLAGAVGFAAALAPTATHAATRDKPLPKLEPGFFDTARARVEKKSRGQTAPLVCVECVEAAFRLPFEEGVRFEREQFERCVVSDQAAALRHAFFAERQANKTGIDPSVKPKDINQIGVIGAGTMGTGITIALLKAGYKVRQYDLSEQALSAGYERICSTLQADTAKKRLDQESCDAALAAWQGVASLEAFAGVDLVVEAAFEDMALKQKIFSRLGGLLPDAILATNTSYLDIDEIASAASGATGNVVGMHFFSPANIMRLLEVVRGRQSSPQALVTAMSVGKSAGKTPVIAGNCHGFIGNRLYGCYQREANFLIEEGALPEQVDRALTDFGFAMGPFAVSDLAGLDIGWANRKAQAENRDPDKRYSIVADRICEQGRFGQKTGSGFYRYPEGSRQGVEEERTTELIFQASEELGISRRDISDEEIVDRCVLAIVNEGASVLEEGIALRSSDVDLVWLFGYGFPRWRGGPMFYAEQIGLEYCMSRISSFHEKHDFWQPSQLLQQRVGGNKRFFDRD